MNYKSIYKHLIEKRKKTPGQGYIEKHHIIMRSMGGSDNKDNIVALTGREHWLAHLLLYKIYRNDKTKYACFMMHMNCKNCGRPRIKNSRMYEIVRKEFIKSISIFNKNRLKETYGTYGPLWICNVKLKKNKMISKTTPIPKGWVRGRNKWNTLKTCTHCGKHFYHKYRKTCSFNCRKQILLKERPPLSKEHREAIKTAALGHKRQTGIKNSQYGKRKIWICNDMSKETKRIDKTEEIPEGWKMGRSYGSLV
jgi:ribosomal protein L37E